MSDSFHFIGRLKYQHFRFQPLRRFHPSNHPLPRPTSLLFIPVIGIGYKGVIKIFDIVSARKYRSLVGVGTYNLLNSLIRLLHVYVPSIIDDLA